MNLPWSLLAPGLFFGWGPDLFARRGASFLTEVPRAFFSCWASAQIPRRSARYPIFSPDLGYQGSTAHRARRAMIGLERPAKFIDGRSGLRRGASLRPLLPF